VQSKR